MTFTCPRCQDEVAEAFYGPCGPCRNDLHVLKPPARDKRFVRRASEDGYRDLIEFKP